VGINHKKVKGEGFEILLRKTGMHQSGLVGFLSVRRRGKKKRGSKKGVKGLSGNARFCEYEFTRILEGKKREPSKKKVIRGRQRIREKGEEGG